MTNHPLTDEICKTIYCTWPEEHQTSLVCDNMRAAADWQLEQVIEWLFYCRDYDLSHIRDRVLMRKELRNLMRPQQQEDN